MKHWCLPSQVSCSKNWHVTVINKSNPLINKSDPLINKSDPVINKSDTVLIKVTQLLINVTWPKFMNIHRNNFSRRAWFYYRAINKSDRNLTFNNNRSTFNNNMVTFISNWVTFSNNSKNSWTSTEHIPHQLIAARDLQSSRCNASIELREYSH